MVTLLHEKVSFVYRTKETFSRDAFLAERDAHCVRDADFVCDARLRRVCGTHRITYHSVAASLLTKLFDVANSFKIITKSVVPRLHPQGVRRIRKAAKPPTAAQPRPLRGLAMTKL